MAEVITLLERDSEPVVVPREARSRQFGEPIE